ncbi:uncharacterized protein ATNIH1004_008483 [Aspergillus tanneri]|uniref:Uncharacterized protein n=1 Tax=Aspergillus tanneri TaxID=1220188 RepID=A0A5M9MB54_9EURO|nr:uncharacterized protein ATNIH1004_008483 [Aspergillus tanneri]KAA8644282.1 hypothetical protein ATNIH1004_008483 [Aspergillus tanneri]
MERTRNQELETGNGSPDLGAFSFIHISVRYKIWAYLAPVCIDTWDCCVQKVDLNILAASYALYKEVSRIIYDDSCWERTEWKIAALSDFDRWLGNLPFHLFKRLTIRIFPSDPRMRTTLYFHWQRVSMIAKLISHASSAKLLVMDRAGNQTIVHRYDHDIMSHPFSRCETFATGWSQSTVQRVSVS